MDKSKERQNKWSFGKNWDLIGVAIFPYMFYILDAVYLDINFVDTIINLLFRLSYPVALVLVIKAGIRNVKREILNAKDMAWMNLIIKFVYMPMFVFNVIIGFVSVLNPLTIGFIVNVIFHHFLFISISGIWGIFCVIKAVREKKMMNGMAILWGISQLVYCVDVIAAIILYVKMAKKGKIESKN